MKSILFYIRCADRQYQAEEAVELSSDALEAIMAQFPRLNPHWHGEGTSKKDAMSRVVYSPGRTPLTKASMREMAGTNNWAVDLWSETSDGAVADLHCQFRSPHEVARTPRPASNFSVRLDSGLFVNNVIDEQVVIDLFREAVDPLSIEVCREMNVESIEQIYAKSDLPRRLFSPR